MPVNEISEKELLRLAASLERASEHPLAAAIVAGAEEREVELTKTKFFESITGKGVKGFIDERLVGLGNQAFLKEIGIDSGPLGDKAEALRLKGQTVVFV